VTLASHEAQSQGEVPAKFDAARVEAAVRELLLGIGDNPERDGLRDTPARVAKAAAELFSGLHSDPRAELEAVYDVGHQEFVLVRDIAFYSMCEHHLMPFHGRAHVGYIPGQHGRVTGLSKLARLVGGFARRLQLQERLTSEVADAVMKGLDARGAIVVIEAEHLCMSMRGVRTPGAKTVTSAVRGVLRSAATRAEAMSLILGNLP